jgi:hypothetical protein
LHPAVRSKQQSALIEVGRHFVADFGLGENVDGHLQIAAQGLGVARHCCMVRLRPGTAHSPAQLQAGVDLLVGDQILEELKRCHALADEVLCLFRTVALDELRVRQAVTMTDHAARAARCTIPRRSGFEYDHGPARAGERQRRRQTRIASADDRDVAMLRQRDIDRPFAWRRIPPIGLMGSGRRFGQHVLSPSHRPVAIVRSRGIGRCTE